MAEDAADHPGIVDPRQEAASATTSALAARRGDAALDAESEADPRALGYGCGDR